MSRKSIISFIAVGVLAAATLGSGAAQAGGGGGRGPHPHAHMHDHAHWKHWHYVHFHDRVYVRPVAYTVRTPSPGPCLTKNYTPDGKVVFADLCIKEMASAPVDGSADHAEDPDRPTNMAGQTYQDYLKANPQQRRRRRTDRACPI